jgi:rod shape-determining protein MreD
MNLSNTILILAAAYLAVFAEAAWQWPRHLFGAQVDLLPALMIYAALNADVVTVSLLAVLGGLWFDSLSANPLGVTILPLFAIGFPVWLRRDLILRELPFAQLILCAAASAAMPVLSLLLLLTAGRELLLGWGSLWQWLLLTAGGAAAAPLTFLLFDWCNHALGYQPYSETSFRPDREIRRDKNVKL